MKKISVEEIVKNIEVVNNASDFAVVDGNICFNGYVGKKGYRAKLGDAILRSISAKCEVRMVEDTRFTGKGTPFTVALIPTKSLKADEVAYIIDLANKAMKKNAEDYKATKTK